MESLTTKKRAKKRARLAARPATNKGETLSALRLPGHTQHAPDPGTRHPPWSQAGAQDAPLLILFGMSRSRARSNKAAFA